MLGAQKMQHPLVPEDVPNISPHHELQPKERKLSELEETSLEPRAGIHSRRAVGSLPAPVKISRSQGKVALNIHMASRKLG